MNMLTRWVPGDILVAVADGGVLALDGKCAGDGGDVDPAR